MFRIFSIFPYVKIYRRSFLFLTTFPFSFLHFPHFYSFSLSSLSRVFLLVDKWRRLRTICQICVVKTPPIIPLSHQLYKSPPNSHHHHHHHHQSHHGHHHHQQVTFTASPHAPFNFFSTSHYMTLWLVHFHSPLNWIFSEALVEVTAGAVGERL